VLHPILKGIPIGIDAMPTGTGFTGCNTKNCTLFHLMILVHFLALKERNIPAQGKVLGKNISMETTIANIFFVKNDHIIETPPVCNNSLLDGIIRKYLIKNIIPEINIIEKNIEFFKIQNYKEVFITNSLKLVQNVDQINDFKYNNCNTSNIIINFLIQKLLVINE